MRRLADNDNSSIIVRDPIESGIVPTIELESKSKDDNNVIVLIVFGIVPVNELYAIFIYFILKKFPIELGSDPIKSALYKSILSRLP